MIKTVTVWDNAQLPTYSPWTNLQEHLQYLSFPTYHPEWRWKGSETSFSQQGKLSTETSPISLLSNAIVAAKRKKKKKHLKLKAINACMIFYRGMNKSIVGNTLETQKAGFNCMGPQDLWGACSVLLPREWFSFELDMECLGFVKTTNLG